MSRLGMVAGLGAVTSLLLTACSSSHDAWFANPCDHALTIRTLYAERGTEAAVPSDEVIATATLRPASVTKVDDAFQDANGFTWFVQVGDRPPLRFTEEEMPEWFVALPASVC